MSGSFALILGACLVSLAYVIPVLTTEIDPNLMRPQCPGGKDWDLLGSSCQGGIIFDYYMPPVAATKSSEIGQKKTGGLKKKRDH